MLATNILFLDARLTNYFKKEQKSIKSKKPFEKKVIVRIRTTNMDYGELWSSFVLCEYI